MHRLQRPHAVASLSSSARANTKSLAHNGPRQVSSNFNSSSLSNKSLLWKRKPCNASTVAAARQQDSSWYEVEDVSPPPQNLGIQSLPPVSYFYLFLNFQQLYIVVLHTSILTPKPQNTHNGDQIEVKGDSYVVQKVILRYRLVRGRYRQDHRRLEVRRTGRFLYNK